ncbi:MAG TPA: helix-turn-helix domain-containing protein [bacterium]|jgi:DNA-binding transcriptional regulator YiaG|nr:helix-turn-helix domain-containing protein [bacterium]
MAAKLTAAQMKAMDKKFPEARAEAKALRAYLEGGKLPAGFVVTRHRMPPDRDELRKIRKSLGLSQAELAGLLQTPKKTYQNWEQGLRAPLGAVGVLLRLLEMKPELVADLKAV